MPLMLIQNTANAWMQQVWVRPTRDFKTTTAGVRRTEEDPIILHPYALGFINNVATGGGTNGNIEHMNLFRQASVAELFKKMIQTTESLIITLKIATLPWKVHAHPQKKIPGLAVRKIIENNGSNSKINLPMFNNPLSHDSETSRR